VAGDLGRRVSVAAVGIPLGVLLLYLGGWYLTAAVVLLAVVGTREAYGLAEARGWRPFQLPGLAAAIFLVLTAGAMGSYQPWAPVALAVLLVLVPGLLAGAVFRRGPDGDPLLAVATTLLGLGYATLPMAFAVFLRELPEQLAGVPVTGWAAIHLLLFPLVVTWLGDTFAYFTGKHLGRRKLIPSVSPKKTVAGSVGGIAGSALGAVVLALLFLGPDAVHTLPLPTAGILGAVLGAVAQVGDLAESVLKREAGVKDSGNLLPGHGGVLDRFDAIYFTLPLTYLAFLFVLV